MYVLIINNETSQEFGLDRFLCMYSFLFIMNMLWNKGITLFLLISLLKMHKSIFYTASYGHTCVFLNLKIKKLSPYKC
jgi:hypothetical protein